MTPVSAFPLRIPLARPLLPTADKLKPYLERIDTNRYYTNFGPLNAEYETRLETLFGAPVVSASSATSALTATLIALDCPHGSFIACPSWTFVATPASIIAAGHVPYFVEEKSFIHLFEPRISPALKAFISVPPFGMPVSSIGTAQLNSLSENGCGSVIIDAAAGFDAFSTIGKSSGIPIIVSTHATKSFCTGEGGFVTCNDTQLLDRIRHIINFGIESSTSMTRTGINAKMSEYHSAVGLAELDGWAAKRRAWLRVRNWYNEAFGLPASRYITSTFIMPVENAEIVDAVIQRLHERNIIAARPRYGCHNLAPYKKCPRAPLLETERLMDTTIQLPLCVDMTQEEVHRVVKVVKECA